MHELSFSSYFADAYRFRDNFNCNVTKAQSMAGDRSDRLVLLLLSRMSVQESRFRLLQDPCS